MNKYLYASAEVY